MIELIAPQYDGHVHQNTEEQVAWLNNPQLMRYSEQRHLKHTSDTQREYIKSFVEHPDNIFREIHHGSKMVGTITAYVDTKNRVADLGILIGSGHGGKGYGYQAWTALCEILFDKCNMRRVEAGCMAANFAMAKICKRYGMREEGRRMSHFIVEGVYSDLVLYGRFR